MVTRCWYSSSLRPASASLLPIMKVPGPERHEGHPGRRLDVEVSRARCHDADREGGDNQRGDANPRDDANGHAASYFGVRSKTQRFSARSSERRRSWTGSRGWRHKIGDWWGWMLRLRPDPKFGIALLFVALTIVLTWPIALHPASTMLPLGPDGDLFIWTLAWDAHAFVHQPAVDLRREHLLSPAPHAGVLREPDRQRVLRGAGHLADRQSGAGVEPGRAPVLRAVRPRRVRAGATRRVSGPAAP